MRPKLIVAALAALLVLALIVRQVMQAVRHTFMSHATLAQVDRSTPMTQNGLTLVEIQNVNLANSYSYSEGGPNLIALSRPEDETGLWISLSSVPDGMASGCAANTIVGSIHCDQFFSVTGHSSTGSVFALSWQFINDVGNHLLVTLPPGYPDSYRWVDVTVDDKHSGKATWRIKHLPPMRHVLAPPILPQTTFYQGNIQAVARAYAAPDPGNPSPVQGIRYDLKGTITGAAHPWEIGHLTQTLEWEPPNFVAQDAGMTMETGKNRSTINIHMQGQPLFYNQSLPYLHQKYLVRLATKLQEFATYDEVVTFHNVSVVKANHGSLFLAGTGPQTVTSPSGVRVTLDDVQHHPDFTSQWGGNGYGVHLLYPQATLLASLPRSPFWRKYQCPIKISADIPKPYLMRGSSTEKSDGTFQFAMDEYRAYGVLPIVFSNFPIIIRQRVDLRTVPMTFTLPVLDKVPIRPL